MRLPPEQANEPEWLRVQRRVQKEEQSWNYGGWTASLVAGTVFAFVGGVLEAGAYSDEMMLAVSAALFAAGIIVIRRVPKGTFIRGFVIWSLPLYGLVSVLSLSKLV